MRILAVLFGLAFIAAGILGYMPTYVTDGNLLGIFEVDSIHNMAYLITGLLGLLAASSFAYSRLYFQLFGILYAIVTVCGFVFAGDLYLAHVNTADNILHLVIAVIFLFLGFIFRTEM